jgi:hypothetical protein
MNSTMMNDKNMALLCEEFNKCVCNDEKKKECQKTNCSLKVICYSPKNASGTVSLIKTANNEERKTVTTDQDLVVIPSNAIIDCVEFFGINNFLTKGSINIGLGQLNGAILMPLVDNTDSTIANEKIGGCRHFICNAQNGKNNRNLVLFDSNINLVLEHPVTSGMLQVIITYHMKPSTTFL